MSAIERCRTAALGGHVARCEDCAHTVIAYNSCRNRHCPKCQGAAAKEWLANREAELLPVRLLSCRIHAAGADRDIAYQNKTVLSHLFKAGAETMLTIAADTTPRCQDRHHCRVHTWGSALTHHPHLHMIVPGGGIAPTDSAGCRAAQDFFLPVRVLSRLFRRLFLQMLDAATTDGRLNFFGDHAERATPAFTVPRTCAGPNGWSTANGRSADPGGARLSRPLHPPRRHLQPPVDRGRRDRRHLQVEGLPDRRTRRATSR